MFQQYLLLAAAAGVGSLLTWAANGPLKIRQNQLKGLPDPAAAKAALDTLTNEALSMAGQKALDTLQRFHLNLP